MTDSVTVLAGVFNGSPIPWDSPNTPRSNPNGVSFPLDTGTLAIAELQYAYGSGASGKPNADGPLPGVYKIGAWYDSYKFDDQQYDTMGVPLASPLSNGMPATHHGDFSLYGVMDQMIWRSKDNANRSLNVFFRPMFTPYEDRNLVSASINAGFALHAPLPGRDNDAFGVEMGTVWASSGASGFDRQMQFFQPSVYTPIRSSETFLEATYQFQALPSWQIQPDVQYFINPGHGNRQPGRSDAADQERTGDRPAHEHHVLRRLVSAKGAAARAAGCNAALRLARRSFRAASAHPELALQAGRRGRVLEGQFLVRVDVTMRALGGERGLVEARQDQLELARIGVDVADGENAGNAGFELRRVDGDQILVQVDPPAGDRPELHRQAEERHHVVAGVVVSPRRFRVGSSAPKAGRPRP